MPSFKDQSTKLVIRLARYGCTNRPFYHIVVIPNRRPREGKIKEQLGTYDPMPNVNNERLVAVDMMRLNWYWANGATLSKPIARLLGILGYLPVHPTTKLAAYRNRQRKEKEETNKQEEKKSETDESE